MNRSLFLLVSALLPLSDVVAGCTLATVEQRDAELNRAISAHDVSTASQYYADAFVLTTSRGNRKTKTNLLTEINSPAVHLEINQTQNVTVLGDHQTAVLVATLRQKGRVGDQQFDVELLVTDTWICNAEGQWLLLAGHASKV